MIVIYCNVIIFKTVVFVNLLHMICHMFNVILIIKYVVFICCCCYGVM